MLKFVMRVESGEASDTEACATLTLPLEQRVKGRLRVVLDDGREAGLFLERGPILRGGDLLKEQGGEIIRVCAAPEPVSVVRCADLLLFARVCYHLGNRHTPLQIGAGELRYTHDHVLDEMVARFGLEPTYAQLPFEPEQGAYGEHGMAHAHGGTALGHAH